MQFRGFTLAQINEAAAIAAIGYPQAGLRFDFTSQRGRTINGVLRVGNSRAYGARMSASGRRTCSASWEAHRDFMRALFLVNPTGRITSALADYRGAEDFERKFLATYSHQVGSQACPAAFGDLSTAGD